MRIEQKVSVQVGRNNQNIKLGAKMKAIRPLVVMLFCLLVIGGSSAQSKKLNAAEAKDHIGERATVCGKVVSVHFAGRSRGPADVSESG